MELYSNDRLGESDNFPSKHITQQEKYRLWRAQLEETARGGHSDWKNYSRSLAREGLSEEMTLEIWFKGKGG